MAALLKAIDASLVEVRIDQLKERTFYATVKIKCHDRVSEVDARPSDALALAILMDCPVLVAEVVMAQASAAIPERPASTGEVPAHAGMPQILEDIKSYQNHFKGGIPLSSGEIHQATQLLIDRLYQ